MMNENCERLLNTMIEKLNFTPHLCDRGDLCFMRVVVETYLDTLLSD